MHHSRFLRTGSVGEGASRRTANAGSTCEAHLCSSAAERRGKCRKHYRMALLAEREACCVEGCDKPWEVAGLCGMHHSRSLNGGIGEPGYRSQRYGSQQCTVASCDKRAKSQWMCKTHYGFWLTTGKQPSVFVNCLTCGCEIDLRASGHPGVLLANRRRMCRACLLLRPRGRWCMTTKQLAKRDGRVCSLCDEAVDMTLAWPDPMSPSVDHIVPRSRGGLDVPQNVALAHLRCNVSKGIRVSA
ncbi:HNH endonuclease [Streptomyces sp. NPDC038707]|uniref:HNH endonuclease n=1 Tax=Streptomyces sp. NPDC038707 TaxID=3154329 RepID=UPI0033EAB9F2